MRPGPQYARSSILCTIFALILCRPCPHPHSNSPRLSRHRHSSPPAKSMVASSARATASRSRSCRSIPSARSVHGRHWRRRHVQDYGRPGRQLRVADDIVGAIAPSRRSSCWPRARPKKFEVTLTPRRSRCRRARRRHGGSVRRAGVERGGVHAAGRRTEEPRERSRRRSVARRAERPSRA